MNLPSYSFALKYYRDNSQAETLMTVDDVAMYLGISASHIYHALQENRFGIPHVRIAEQYRFRKQDVNQYVSDSLIHPAETKNQRLEKIAGGISR